MLKRAAGVMLLVAALSANVFADSDFEFKGYLRAGAVYNQNMNAINTGLFEPDSGDVNKIGRLGVGENNFLEAELVKNFKVGKSWAKAHIMFAHSTTDTPTFSGSTAVRQAFVEMGGMPLSPNATFWIGKKFNGRDDIHILDKYWRVQSGTGLGVQNILNGNMDISFVTGANNGPADKDGGEVANATLDMRYRIQNAGPGTLELEGAYTILNGNSDTDVTNADNGLQVAAIYGMNSFFNLASGFSKAAVQYGINSAAGNVGDAQDGNNGKDGDAMYRLLAYGLANVGENWQIMPSVVYESKMPDAGKDTSVLSLAVRPVYKINNNISLQIEGGYAIEDNGTDSYSKYKITAAPTMKLDTNGFFNRPELRVFVTYIGQDKELGKVSRGAGDDESEIRFGSQAEVWF
jgi:maltoporin